MSKTRPDDGSTPRRPRVLPNRDPYSLALRPDVDVDGGPIVRVYGVRDRQEQSHD